MGLDTPSSEEGMDSISASKGPVVDGDQENRLPGIHSPDVKELEQGGRDWRVLLSEDGESVRVGSLERNVDEGGEVEICG